MRINSLIKRKSNDPDVFDDQLTDSEIQEFKRMWNDAAPTLGLNEEAGYTDDQVQAEQLNVYENDFPEMPPYHNQLRKEVNQNSYHNFDYGVSGYGQDFDNRLPDGDYAHVKQDCSDAQEEAWIDWTEATDKKNDWVNIFGSDSFGSKWRT